MLTKGAVDKMRDEMRVDFSGEFERVQLQGPLHFSSACADLLLICAPEVF